MRIRTIKPEFFTHDGLYDAEQVTQLPLRLAYIGLWCSADREGRFKWEPRRLKAGIFPYDDLDFSRVLDALTTRGWLVKYSVGDDYFGAIPSWRRHQSINNQERASELPEITESIDVADASSTRQARVDDASAPARARSGKGKEGKGRGKTRGEHALFVFEIPPELDTPEFRQAWEERTACIKSKVNAAGLSAQLKRCAGMGYDLALAAVRHSLTYQGLVEPPANGPKPPGSHLRPEERPDPRPADTGTRVCQQCGAIEDSPLKSNPEFDVSLTRHNGELICSDCFGKAHTKQAVP